MCRFRVILVVAVLLSSLHHSALRGANGASPVSDETRRHDDALSVAAHEGILRLLGSAVDTELHLSEVAKYERVINRDHDLPLAQIEKTPSRDLLERVMESPVVVTCYLYDDVNLGIERLARSLDVFGQFLSRDDAVNTLLDYMSALDLESLLRDPDRKRAGTLCIKWDLCCKILRSPRILAKVAGHERQALRVLVERVAMIRRVHSALGEKTRERRLNLLECGTAALAIWEQFDRDAALDWQSSNRVRKGPSGTALFGSKTGFDDLFKEIAERLVVD